MVSKVYKDVSEIIDNYSGLSRKVLDYNVVTKRMNEECKSPEFPEEAWDEHFSKVFDTENFQRIGHLKEVMDYPTYLRFQTQWAPKSYWECSFKRITESDNVVVLELEERATFDGVTNVVNTVSIYEFNETGKIFRLDVYLQQQPASSAEVPDGYKGIAK